MTAAEQLRARMGELADLRSLGKLVEWDGRTMMPPAGAAARGDLVATLERLTHERAGADDLEAIFDAVERDPSDPLSAALARLGREDWERTRLVPPELSAAIAAAGADGLARWQRARAADDFTVFAPAVERNVELARAYAGCFAGTVEHPYDALLANFDPGLPSAMIATLFSRLAEQLPPLVAAASRAVPEEPLDATVLRRAAGTLLGRLGVDDHGWRLDEAAHPFSSSIGPRDSRLALRFGSGDPRTLLLALHEFGHSLYERQIAPGLMRTVAGRGASMSVHESQSKLWEDQVGRRRAFAPVLSAALQGAGYAIAPDDLHRRLTRVRPGTNRIAADPVTYPLHVILRFELERALISGDLAVHDVPAAWRDRTRELLGVEVGSDNDGPLQDDHWADGAFGYFPSYALGAVLAAQLWEALERDLGPQDEALRAGGVDAIKAWLEEHVHRHGRLFGTVELARRATGSELGADAFLRYAADLARHG